jgi:hypothetical protein
MKLLAVEAGCGDTVERNRTYIINNGTTSGTCTYTIAPVRTSLAK